MLRMQPLQKEWPGKWGHSIEPGLAPGTGRSETNSTGMALWGARVPRAHPSDVVLSCL